MRANGWTRRRWAVALVGSLLVHALLTRAHLRAVPALNEDELVSPIHLLRITKAPPARGRPVLAAARAPRATPRSTGHRAVAPRRRPALAPGAAETSAERAVPAGPNRTAATAPAGGTRSSGPAAPGPSDSPGPEPSLTPEMLAALNDRLRGTLPSASPATIKRYPAELERLAVRPAQNRVTAANYPLPTGGIFAHALIVRVGHEAAAIRLVKRIGRGYLCIGYLAKVDDRGVGASLAGPYAGPCKRAWLPQLGLAPPEPSPTPAPTASPTP